MNKIILNFLAFLQPLFTSQGIDFSKMMTIIETKLTMDKRRVYMHWKQRQQKKENANHLNGVLFMYAIMGLFVGALLGLLSSLMMSMIIFHAYIILMMSLTLITDFSTVLLDTADNQILLPKPINSKTLFMARLIHILIYILQFTIAISIIPLAIATVKYGFVAGVLLMFTIPLTVLIAVFFTYFLYLLIIRFSSKSKVKDIVNYFQIFMTIFFTVGYQILPRLLNFSNIDFQPNLKWYTFLLPPVWMATTVDAFVNQKFDLLHLSMILCALFIPAIIFWILIKFLAPAFASKIEAMSNNDSKKIIKNENTSKQIKSSLSYFFSDIFCTSSTEKSGFEITWKMTSRDKSFKLQFYPSFAYIFVFAFIFVFNSGKKISAIWDSLSTTNHFLFFIYIPMLTIVTALGVVVFNENFAASWIYHSTPIVKPGNIIAGMAKSLFVKFFMPIYVLVSSFCLYVWGIRIVDDIIFALFNNLFCFLLVVALSENYFPFSRQPNTQQQSGKFLKGILQIIVIAILILIHALIIKISIYWLFWILALVLLFASFLLLKKIQNLNWHKIQI